MLIVKFNTKCGFNFIETNQGGYATTNKNYVEKQIKPSQIYLDNFYYCLNLMLLFRKPVL